MVAKIKKQGGETMGELKYLTMWKDGRLIFLKREEFERPSLWKRICRKVKRLIRK
jgi:hypothetical protein